MWFQLFSSSSSSSASDWCVFYFFFLFSPHHSIYIYLCTSLPPPRSLIHSLSHIHLSFFYLVCRFYFDLGKLPLFNDAAQFIQIFFSLFSWLCRIRYILPHICKCNAYSVVQFAILSIECSFFFHVFQWRHWKCRTMQLYIVLYIRIWV